MAAVAEHVLAQCRVLGTGSRHARYRDFVPVGISSSGSTLGPRMITPWLADLGKALPPGSAQPAVRNVTYFSSHAIVDPLLILSAWALAGVVALVLAAFLHPPMSSKPSRPADAVTSSG